MSRRPDYDAFVAVATTSLATSSTLVSTRPRFGFFFERWPVVVDANVLIGDSIRLAKKRLEIIGFEPWLLTLTRDYCFVNVYATERVRTEVSRRLKDAAANARLPYSAVHDAYYEELMPATRFVRIDAMPTRDPRLVALATADADDTPTGSLAEILAPCLLFSRNRHFLDNEIGEHEWGRVLSCAADVGIVQTGESLISLGVTVTSSTVRTVGGAALRAARRAPLPTALLLLVGALFGCRMAQTEQGRETIAKVRSVAGDMFSGVQEALIRAEDAKLELEAAAFFCHGDRPPDLLSTVARLVATAPHPLRPSDIGRQLDVSYQRVSPVLDSPVFARATDGTYEIGRRFALKG